LSAKDFGEMQVVCGSMTDVHHTAVRWHCAIGQWIAMLFTSGLGTSDRWQTLGIHPHDIRIEFMLRF
jgi:hypothetical protein